MMVNSGVASVDEVARGKASSIARDLAPPMAPVAVAAAKRAVVRFDREAGRPSFAVGEAVRARGHGVAGHTRLPAYARGRRGRSSGRTWAPWLASNACGDARAEPLYTVGFDASELWPEASGCRDRVFLDLWEGYLEPA
jgi:nitrile hydratase subunit beta